ncbi:sulfate ABC transporter substrate-binding protein [Mycobacterium florentinum]|uniref:Sulfate ABC transporter substrate-binding protein n=1 Tax=Mycobacterium florentinum TaxID=292462 RepID=A0A1X1TWY2_MYCFL|nr:sulfate ABC transporter substrate-binding protein [Mycobacterium florentinum]MCV7413500.1 sulfate ABC transporter substrate-binding protein [Mycobacterium florentinum]ORV49095.1 sulfate ABC transporter substrate-binding protein [Mycobacterium florentinum]BBX77038.1 sulfate ABC transporter substrate-binding protein [Mycobacterium florentinum]
MLDDIGIASRWRPLAALLSAVGLVSACAGGASDAVGGSALNNVNTKITLVAYSVPEPGWSAVIPAFNETREGKGVQVITSYAASADQSRGVVEGKPADVVNFSVEPDITRLVKAGKVSTDWDRQAGHGNPFGSVVTLVVRKGNPKNIRDWDDLLRPGVEVITPSPLSSGSAKWNLLAPYAAKSRGGADPQAGIDFISKLVHEHVKLRPGSGRIATAVFSEGSGDVLISYENEAIAAERQGKPVEHIIPSQTFKIENPVAVVSTSAHLDVATAFKNFQYTAVAQKLWAQAGFRAIDPAVASTFRGQYPVPVKLWTIDDLGGWGSADSQLFDKNTGSITKVYVQATG